MANILKRITMGLGGIVLAALLLALTAPKTVHAVVSALVTIANTDSNPVPTHSVDSPAKTPFFASATCQSISNQCYAQDFLAIPPGMTAVVQDVSGYCRVQDNIGSLAPAYAIPIYTGLGSHNGGAVDISMNPVVPDGGSHYIYHFGRPVTFYVPSTTAAPDTLTFQATMLFGVDCNVVVNGYYVANGS